MGRGLRLCVNREGERQDLEALGEQEVQRVNTLTVIASESYSDFTKSLQKDINDALRERPKAVTEEFLKGFAVQADEEKTYALTQEDAHDVYFALVQQGLIDREGVPTQKFKESGLTSVTDDDLPEHLYAYRKDIEALVKSVYDEHALDDYIRNGNEPKVRENPLNANFARAEFQELWNKINSKHSYTVDFDDEDRRATLDPDAGEPRARRVIRRCHEARLRGGRGRLGRDVRPAGRSRYRGTHHAQERGGDPQGHSPRQVPHVPR